MYLGVHLNVFKYMYLGVPAFLKVVRGATTPVPSEMARVIDLATSMIKLLNIYTSIKYFLNI